MLKNMGYGLVRCYAIFMPPSWADVSVIQSKSGFLVNLVWYLLSR